MHVLRQASPIPTHHPINPASHAFTSSGVHRKNVQASPSCHFIVARQLNAIASQSCSLPSDVLPFCSYLPSAGCRADFETGADFEMLRLADGSLFVHGQAGLLGSILAPSLVIEMMRGEECCCACPTGAPGLLSAFPPLPLWPSVWLLLEDSFVLVLGLCCSFEG
jgi:hypothetical protein